MTHRRKKKTEVARRKKEKRREGKTERCKERKRTRKNTKMPEKQEKRGEEKRREEIKNHVDPKKRKSSSSGSSGLSSHGLVVLLQESSFDPFLSFSSLLFPFLSRLPFVFFPRKNLSFLSFFFLHSCSSSSFSPARKKNQVEGNMDLVTIERRNERNAA